MRSAQKFISIIFVGLLYFSVAHSGVLPLRETFPWPWSCPFPWGSIDGQWFAQGNQTKMFFDLKELSSFEDGYHVIEIRQYDGEHRLIAIGRGVASKDEKIVRAALHLLEGEPGVGYWVFIQQAAKGVNLCDNREETVTAVTLRPFESCNHPDGCDHADVSYPMYRMSKSPR